MYSKIFSLTLFSAGNIPPVVSDPQMEKLYSILAFSQFLKHTMFFHASGPLLLLFLLIPHSSLALSMARNHVFA